MTTLSYQEYYKIFVLLNCLLPLASSQAKPRYTIYFFILAYFSRASHNNFHYFILLFSPCWNIYFGALATKILAAWWAKVVSDVNDQNGQ